MTISMTTRICFSKKIGYIAFVLIILIIGAILYGSMVLNVSISLFPQAKEKSSFLNARKKIPQTIPNSVSCGGENEPVCLSADSFYCLYSDLHAYTKPTNKTFNQECSVNFNYDVVNTWFPDDNPNMNFEDKINAVVDVFADNRYPKFQAYDQPVSKIVEKNGNQRFVTIVGIDPGQICKRKPYFISEVPEVCPVSQDVSCGAAGQECCITRVYDGGEYDTIQSDSTKYRFECENPSLFCDQSNTSQLYMNRYMIFIREINHKYAVGSLFGSKCSPKSDRLR